MKGGYKENIVLPGGDAECLKYSYTKVSPQGPTSLPPSPAPPTLLLSWVSRIHLALLASFYNLATPRFFSPAPLFKDLEYPRI